MNQNGWGFLTGRGRRRSEDRENRSLCRWRRRRLRENAINVFAAAVESIEKIRSRFISNVDMQIRYSMFLERGKAKSDLIEEDGVRMNGKKP